MVILLAKMKKVEKGELGRKVMEKKEGEILNQ
jgi:hypothetical protein